MNFQLLAVLCIGAVITPPEPYWWHAKISRNPNERTSDYPYLTSDTVRTFCDFKIDETKIPFDTDKVKDGDTIYVNACYMEFFFKNVHPHIDSKYILITHFGDHPVPGYYAEYLEDENLALWVGQNVEQPDHPKLMSIPIGITPKNLHFETHLALNKVIQFSSRLRKQYLLYLNQHDGTNPVVRGRIRGIFANTSFCFCSSRVSYDEYLAHLACSKFVVSPPGGGHDCYRTWEAMLLGCIPIVERSPVVCLFEDLPVLIIDDWNEVTEEFLNKKHEEMATKTYKLEKLYAEYWLNLIRERQKALRGY